MAPLIPLASVWQNTPAPASPAPLLKPFFHPNLVLGVVGVVAAIAVAALIWRLVMRRKLPAALAHPVFADPVLAHLAGEIATQMKTVGHNALASLAHAIVPPLGTLANPVVHPAPVVAPAAPLLHLHPESLKHLAEAFLSAARAAAAPPTSPQQGA